MVGLPEDATRFILTVHRNRSEKNGGFGRKTTANYPGPWGRVTASHTAAAQLTMG